MVGGATYEVQVRARSDEGVSDWSGSGWTGVHNAAPVVDLGRLRDLDVTIGGAVEVVSLDEAFSEPDGNALTFSVWSTNEAIVIARPEGSVAAVEAVAPGAVDVEVVTTDPHGATASADFKVTSYEATLAEPILGYTPTRTLIGASPSCARSS